MTSTGSTYDITFQEIGSAPRDLNANWGYNELDGYLYTVRPGRTDLYRVDGSGNFVDFANLPNTAFDGSTAGDIFPNGTMVYVGDANSWQLIGLATPTAPIDLGTLELNQSVNVQDIAYNPADGFLYGINRNTGRAFRVDGNGGTFGNVTVIEFGPAIYAGVFASVWFDEDGRFYGYSNTTNNFFLIDTTTGNAVPIANGAVDEGGDSDGASCRGPAPISFGSISGSVYDDLNGSDVREAGETALGAGIRIDLYYDNGTPSNYTDDVFAQTTDTLSDGTYTFSDLVINQSYRIQLDEADPDLGPGNLIGTSNPILGVSVAAGAITADQDFGFDPSGSDLSLSKYAAATGTTTPITAVVEGDTIDWVVTITNSGSGSPSGVKVIDLIPSGFAYVSDDAPATGDSYDPSTGLWFVDEILSGTSETLTITTTVLGSGDFTNYAEIIYSSLPDPDSDPDTGRLTDDLSDQIGDDDEASYAVALQTGSRLLSGRLFVDNGRGGGTAHDGEINGAEAGSKSAQLQILDSGGAEIGAPQVAADGSWSFALSGSYSGPLTVRATPLSSHITISEATAGLDALVNADPHDGEFTFTPEPFGHKSGLNIGLLETPLLTWNRQATVGRGQVAELQHIYTATSQSNVSFTFQNVDSAPANAFNASLFLDSDCDGHSDITITSPIGVVPEQQLCIISRVTAASGAGQGSSYVYQLVAATAFNGTTKVHTTLNTDQVSVTSGTGNVELSKTVENQTIGSPEGTSNLGRAGDILTYRIYLLNTSPQPISNVKVYDRTPPYTSLSAPIADPVTVSPNLTCTVAKPVANVTGYEGDLEWTCSGSFLPGETGAVEFSVAISP